MTVTPDQMPVQRPLPACPTPGKLCYRSKAAAARDARTFKMPRYSPWPAEKKRLFPYECRCGQWHLTSSQARW